MDRREGDSRAYDLRARASVLAGCVRNWQDVISGALDEEVPLADDERIEFLAGYIDPYASWEAILVESAHSFPGATARLRDICDELAALLDEASAREMLLNSAGFFLEGVQTTLDALRPEMATTDDAVVRERFAALDHSIEGLALVFGAGEVSVRERRVLGHVLHVVQPRPQD